jgi:hypothetical protein
MSLNQDEVELLDRVARIHGRLWKSRLRTCWEKADYRHIHIPQQETWRLQFLRNASYFGPRGLIRYRPSGQGR